MIELYWDETPALAAQDTVDQEQTINELGLMLMEVGSQEEQYGHHEDDQFVNEWIADNRY